MTIVSAGDEKAAIGRGAHVLDEASEHETLFLGLVRDYHRRVFNFIYRIVGDEATAEDLTQEAYLRAYRGLPDLPPGSHHRAWLFRIATNAALDELRRRRRRPETLLGVWRHHAAPAGSEDDRLGRLCLREALSRVSPDHRAVLLLFEYAGFTAPEVGEVLGVTPETARKRRQRAREALVRAIGGTEP